MTKLQEIIKIWSNPSRYMKGPRYIQEKNFIYLELDILEHLPEEIKKQLQIEVPDIDDMQIPLQRGIRKTALHLY